MRFRFFIVNRLNPQPNAHIHAPLVAILHSDVLDCLFLHVVVAQCRGRTPGLAQGEILAACLEMLEPAIQETSYRNKLMEQARGIYRIFFGVQSLQWSIADSQECLTNAHHIVHRFCHCFYFVQVQVVHQTFIFTLCCKVSEVPEEAM